MTMMIATKKNNNKRKFDVLVTSTMATASSIGLVAW
jgi:hypothetical protein